MFKVSVSVKYSQWNSGYLTIKGVFWSTTNDTDTHGKCFGQPLVVQSIHVYSLHVKQIHYSVSVLTSNWYNHS